MKQRQPLILVALCLGLLFSLLVIQFFRVQVIEGDRWTKTAIGQHYFEVDEPFRRGSILANRELKQNHPVDEQVFSLDIQRFHLYVDPKSIPEEWRDEIILRLIELLKLPDGEQERFVDQFHMTRSRSRWLKRWLTKEEKEGCLAWWRPFASERRIARNAIYFVSDYQRSFPFGSLLGQVLHTIQERRDDVTRQGIPTGGLEAAYNTHLSGKLGKSRRLRSPRSAFATGELIEEPQDGADLYLSVNDVLQAIMEKELELGVKRAEAKGGWAVMLDPFSGEVLGCAQYPFFEPSQYKEYFNDPDKREWTKVRAITDGYEPGSPMKALTGAIALQGNLELQRMGKVPFFDLEEKIRTGDGSLPGRNRPMTDTRRHEYLNFNMAMQKSSNIYMARITHRMLQALGPEWYRRQLSERFGFGKWTGIELPGETAGVLPTPGKVHPNGTLEWSVPTPYSLAIGYNIQTSAMQMALAYCTLANGGYRVKPSFLRRIVRNGEVIKENPHLRAKEQMDAHWERVLDPEVLERVMEALHYVTKWRGSGYRANVSGYTEIGKTGTSRKVINGVYSNQHHRASFVGFAPATEPRFVLYIGLDEPRPRYIEGAGENVLGGVSAAPIFRSIAKKALEYLGVAPDDPHGYPFGDPRFDGEKAFWHKETQALQELYEEWNL